MRPTQDRPAPDRPTPADTTLGVRGRGMEERISLVNRSMAAWEGELGLEVGATFEDVVEPPTAERPQQGSTSARWDADDGVATIRYTDAEGELRVERGIRVAVSLPAGLGQPAVEEAFGREVLPRFG